MQWEEIKERYIRTYKTKQEQKTCRVIHRVLKLTNVIKHYTKLYRQRTLEAQYNRVYSTPTYDRTTY